MKLGIANRISVSVVELDDTVDVTPTYSDIINVIQLESGVSEVSKRWLESKESGGF